MNEREAALKANTWDRLTIEQQHLLNSLVDSMIHTDNKVFLEAEDGTLMFVVQRPVDGSRASEALLHAYLRKRMTKAYVHGILDAKEEHASAIREHEELSYSFESRLSELAKAVGAPSGAAWAELIGSVLKATQDKRDLQQTVESLSSQLQTFHDRLCDAMLLPRHASWDVLLDTTSATRDLSGQRLRSIQELQKLLDDRLVRAIELTGAPRSLNWAQLMVHLDNITQHFNNYKRLGEEVEGHRTKMCEALQCGSGTGWARITARVSEILKNNDDLSESVRRTSAEREELCRTLRLNGSFSWGQVLGMVKAHMQRLDEQDAQLSALIQQQLANNEVLIERTSAGHEQRQKNMARELGLDENARFSTMMREVRELKAQAQQYKALQAAAKLLMKGLLEEEAR